MSEDKVKKCLVEEIKHIKNMPMRDIYKANCIGYAQALCWVLGRDRLYELLQEKYCNL
jgi:tRNA A37 N6-isopentenylltransferase MiaA|tara:strand:- start:48 stop:221 length:174 start_codon:yes stop_codon:yes gene_type:complete